MGLLSRLAAALGKNLTVEFSTGSLPAGGPSLLTDQPPPQDTVSLFVFRMSRLADEEWRAVIATWEAMATDPVQLAAREAAEQAAVASERASGRRVEFRSDVRVETRGLGGAIVGSSNRVRDQVAQLRAQMERRESATRDALAALAVRDLLTPEQFAILYRPFEPFIPRAQLEGLADWQSPARPLAGPAALQPVLPPAAAAQPDEPASATLKALDDLRVAGVLNEAEYLAKRAALHESRETDVGTRT